MPVLLPQTAAPAGRYDVPGAAGAILIPGQPYPRILILGALGGFRGNQLPLGHKIRPGHRELYCTAVLRSVNHDYFHYSVGQRRLLGGRGCKLLEMVKKYLGASEAKLFIEVLAIV
jgi:hypothetical protein